MEILFMVFMVVVSIMALFAVMVVFRDVVAEVLASRRERDKHSASILAHAERIIAEAEAAKEAAKSAAPVAPAVAPVAEAVPATEPVVEVAPVEEPVVEEPVEEPATEEPAEEPAAEEDEEGKISFSKSQQQTLEEKYLALTPEQRRWYDEIIKYASAVEGSKRFKNVRHEEYKVGKNRIVRMLIKRGVIQCEFMLHNSDFKNYVSENKITVKHAPTVILVDSAATVDAVKSSIDIAVAAIAEEKEYKKKLAREKRKAAREAADSAAE